MCVFTVKRGGKEERVYSVKRGEKEGSMCNQEKRGKKERK